MRMIAILLCTFYMIGCQAGELKRRADHAYFKEDWTKAHQYYQATHKLAPDHPETLIRLGETTYHCGNILKALFWFNKYINISDLKSKANLKVGKFLYLQGDFQHAEAYLKKVVALKKDFVNVWRKLGRLYQKQKKYPEMCDTYKTIINLQTKPSAQDFFRLGQAAYYLNDFDLAKQNLEKASKIPEADIFLKLITKHKEKVSLVSATPSVRNDTNLDWLSISRPKINPSKLIRPSKSKIALVIGNAEYQKRELKNPVNDAVDMARSLRSINFDVDVVTNRNFSQMETDIHRFCNKMKTKPGGIGLFYYSGHGSQVNNINYLIPINANIKKKYDVKYKAVPAQWILESMEGAGNAANIIILDACRDNPFRTFDRSLKDGLAFMAAPTGSIIAYSTAPGKYAADGSGRNGVYTKALLKNIEQKNLSLIDVFMKTRQEVLEETNYTQEPWESSSLRKHIFLNK